MAAHQSGMTSKVTKYQRGPGRLSVCPYMSGPAQQASSAQGQATEAAGGDSWSLFLLSFQQAQQSQVMTLGSDSLRGTFLSSSHGQCP